VEKVDFVVAGFDAEFPAEDDFGGFDYLSDLFSCEFGIR
jgi:hypothetical protein